MFYYLSFWSHYVPRSTWHYSWSVSRSMVPVDGLNPTLTVPQSDNRRTNLLQPAHSERHSFILWLLRVSASMLGFEGFSRSIPLYKSSRRPRQRFWKRSDRATYFLDTKSQGYSLAVEIWAWLAEGFILPSVHNLILTQRLWKESGSHLVPLHRYTHSDEPSLLVPGFSTLLTKSSEPFFKVCFNFWVLTLTGFCRDCDFSTHELCQNVAIWE